MTASGWLPSSDNSSRVTRTGRLQANGGYAWADTDNVGDDSGYFIGGGYEHMVTQNISIGGEVLYHQFDNFGTVNTDIDATTAQVRATFRF